jgi:hypothetical protein
MDRNTEMFAACDETFDRGRLIAIYPEGVTRSEALGYEAHAPGRLTVVPVGLSFEARRRFRGRVLVSAGEPVDVSSLLPIYSEEPAKALHALTAAIQRAMEREVVHVDRDAAVLARSVEELCRGSLERELWNERVLGPADRSVPALRVDRRRGRSTSAHRIPGASSGSGSGCSATTALPSTGSVTRPCGPASNGRRSGRGWHGHGRQSEASRSSRTGRP